MTCQHVLTYNNIHLLYEVDVIKEEFNTQEKIKRHIGFLLLGILLPSLWGHFGQFGVGINEEKLIICVYDFRGGGLEDG